PAEDACRYPGRARGVPGFKSKDTVLRRPGGDPATPTTVAPGTFEFDIRTAPATAHGPQPDTAPGPPPGADAARSGRHAGSGGHRVTWWDPRALHLGAAASFGLRRDDLIVKDGDMFAVEDRLADYERWRDERAKTIEEGARPTVRLQTATAWAADAAASGI